MQRITRTVLGVVAAGVAASACNGYEVRARVVRMVAGAPEVLQQADDGCWILPAPVAEGEEVRLRLQIGVFDDDQSDAPAGGVVGWINGSISALCGVNSRTPGSIGPFADPAHPEHNGVPQGDPFNSIAGIEGVWGIRPSLTWICNGGGFPPLPPPPIVGVNDYVSVYEVTHEASGYAGCCTISIAGQGVAASEWHVIGTPVPPFCGNPGTPNDDRPGSATYAPMTVPPVAFGACVRICNALPSGGCTPVVGAHCWDDLGCVGIGPTYMTTITLECGEMHTDPNLFLGSIVEFIDANGEIDLADLALLLPGWDAVMRPTSTIIPTGVPDSPSMPNIVFRYRGSAPILAPQVIGPFPFRRATGAPPVGTMRYATRTFDSGAPQTQWGVVQFVPLPGSIDGAIFRPVGGVQLRPLAIGGDTGLLIDQVGSSGSDGVNVDWCEELGTPAEGHWRQEIIPWMLPEAPPLGAYVQVGLDGTNTRGGRVQDVLQMTFGSFGSGHMIHFGTSLAPSALGNSRIELRLRGAVVQTFVLDPCDVFGGFIPQSLCDWFVDGFCYLNPDDPECRCYANPGVCSIARIGGFAGNPHGAYIALSNGAEGALFQVRRPGGPVFTIDEICFAADVSPSAVESVDSHRVLGRDIARAAIIETVFVRNTCRADFNGDDAVNSQDFFDFLRAFFDGDPSADFNHDWTINSQDFFDFLGAFFAGC